MHDHQESPRTALDPGAAKARQDQAQCGRPSWRGASRSQLPGFDRGDVLLRHDAAQVAVGPGCEDLISPGLASRELSKCVGRLSSLPPLRRVVQ